MNALLLIDKPTGISSNDALQKIKKLTSQTIGARLRAGHAGTLDPLATGLLPIAFNEATKFLPYLLDADKTYSVTMQLGVRTDTCDATGKIIAERAVPTLSLNALYSVFNTLLGTTQQTPPLFSALKYHGVPLYQYARKGIIIERISRPITIHTITITAFENNHVHFSMRCSKGTYVRALVDEVGEKLGCGAHVTQLRRLSVASFSDDQMITLEKWMALLQEKNTNWKKVLLPIDAALSHFPALFLSAEQTRALQQGKIITLSDRASHGPMRLMNSHQEFFGVGEVLSNGTLVSRRLIAILNS